MTDRILSSKSGRVVRERFESGWGLEEELNQYHSSWGLIRQTVKDDRGMTVIWFLSWKWEGQCVWSNPIPIGRQ